MNNREYRVFMILLAKLKDHDNEKIARLAMGLSSQLEKSIVWETVDKQRGSIKY